MVEYNPRFLALCLCILTKTGSWGSHTSATAQLSPNEVLCLVALEESTFTGCCAQRWTRRLTSCQQGAPICSHIVSHPVLGDKSQSTALSSTEAKWTHFSIMPESVTKARGSEWNMKSPLPPRQTDGQRHSLLFPALCLPSTFGISFRKLEVMT